MAATSPDLCVVVPTIRETSIHEFLAAWAGELEGARVLVVEDNPRRTFALDRPGVEHRAWDDIERELGDRAWIIPRRTDCVRSYGFWRAWQDGAQVIVTLDDDCFPVARGVLAEHRARLDAEPEVPRWVPTGGGVRTRGLPYRRRGQTRRCVLNHGLWTNVPDLDALTQLDTPDPARAFHPVDQVVPHGMYFPMCGMNLAFRRELTPAMYFLLMGPDREFDRFGDIWCGVLV
jgi:reversibly glycosylated polypeptide/UDP-arabinopyranose mutase